MALLLYYISKQVGIFISFCSFVAAGMSLIVTLAAGHRQQKSNAQKGGSHSQHLLDAAVIIFIIMMVLSLLIFICLLFFEYRDMEPVEVPFVDGLSYAEALERLQENNLLEKIVCEDDSEDWDDYVVGEQKPAGGKMVLTKTKVTLFLVPKETQPEESNRPNEGLDDIPLILPSIIIDADPEFSDADVSPTGAAPGEKVTLNVRTSNYNFDLKLIDSNGSELAYERIDFGFFIFIMPDCDVTVRLSKAEDDLPDIPSEPVLPEIMCNYGLECPTRNFPDLDPNEWYHEAVDFAVANNLLSRYENKFVPDGTATRAEVVSLFYKMAGWPDSIIDNDIFTDVSGTDWYAASINWAIHADIIDGYDDNTFRPFDLVTMEQFITILWRYAGSPADRDIYPAFTDKDKISQYAADAVEWAAGQGFLRFTNCVLNPQEDITRVEMAEILKNYMGN